MTQRIQRHPFLATFDGADPSTSTGSRSSTTTPIQALTLMNDPLVHQQAERIAQRILDHAPEPKNRIRFAYQHILGRPASEEELDASNRLLLAAAQVAREGGHSDNESEREAWFALVRAMLRLNEFVYID